MAVEEKDKRVVMDALRELGAKDNGSARGVDIITQRCGQKGPRYRDKQLVALVLQALVNEKRAIRKAGEKAGSYYISPVQPASTAAEAAPELEPVEQKSDNPYL